MGEQNSFKPQIYQTFLIPLKACCACTDAQHHLLLIQGRVLRPFFYLYPESHGKMIQEWGEGPLDST